MRKAMLLIFLIFSTPVFNPVFSFDEDIEEFDIDDEIEEEDELDEEEESEEEEENNSGSKNDR